MVQARPDPLTAYAQQIKLTQVKNDEPQLI